MKILALDTGDVWIGSAISDPLGITCKPYKTVQKEEVIDFICKVVPLEMISTIIVGIPYTMAGTKSMQTIKVIKDFETIKSKVTKTIKQNIKWIMWDERKSSKFAQQVLKGTRTTKKKIQEAKLREHSLAAAFILQGYLDYLAMSQNSK